MTNDTLTLGPGLQVSFLRTLRIPDDGKTYPLPPGMGRFPIRRVDDYASIREVVPFEPIDYDEMVLIALGERARAAREATA